MIRWLMAAELDARRVVPFADIRASDLAEVGGKGANLGEMLAAGFPVPGGFCVTTAAYTEFLATCSEASRLLDEIDALEPEDLDGLRELGQTLRAHIEASEIPAKIDAAIREAFAAEQAEPEQAWAVRSSATLEDLPEASFAGQQDTYLGVRGVEALLDRVRACWASLFTDRAIAYRRRHEFAAGAAHISVVVQRMVRAEIAGILFTADPVTGHRKTASIDASWGLGEAVVSGIVDADNYRLSRDTGELVELRLGAKAIEIRPTSEGTETVDVDPEHRERRALDDGQLAALVELGERVEAHYGAPQDIEWCFESGELFLVQTRPITTLYPIPTAPADSSPERGLHVYISLNHIQVMTDTIHPLGIDTMRHVFPVGKYRDEQPSDIVRSAGGRIYLDMTPALLNRVLRKRLPQLMTLVDPKMAAMVRVVVDRGSFARAEGRVRAEPSVLLRRFGLRVAATLAATLLWRDPADNRAQIEPLVDELVRAWVARLEAPADARARLATARAVMGASLVTLMRQVFPTVLSGVISWKLLRHLCDDDPRLDDLTRGLAGNVTTQMDLELGDLADLARAEPQLRDALADDPELLSRSTELRALPGGEAVDDAWRIFLARYGHRAIGEINLATPRWADDPRSLLRTLVGMLAEPESGRHRAQHEAGRRTAEASAAALVSEARGLRRWLVRRSIARMRVGLALREHPKFAVMQVFAALRQMVVEIAGELVEAGALAKVEDVWWLDYGELERLAGGELGPAQAAERVAERRDAYRGYAKLRPPRVITSEGESPTLVREGELPPGTLEGVAASSGVVEGVARVVLDPTKDHLAPGEILVASFTDPGWTPLFVQASALVMEVGGLMTHGSVVAREYGIPAVVGVDDCTTKIETGQRVRVDGDRGWVVLLES